MPRRFTIISFALVTLLSMFTYGYKYWEPSQFFWDENYHVASAQKYLNGVFFMEPHPPLGKELIALGEWILQTNLNNKQFVGTDHAQGTPPSFSFAGYRLLPAALGWLTAPLLFLIFLRLTRRPIWAGLLSLLYVFDTALIVHARGAMLESPQLFFVCAAILAYLLAASSRRRSREYLWTALLGASFGAIMAIKINGLIFLLLPFLLPFTTLPVRHGPLLPRLRCAVKEWRRVLLSYGVSLGAALCTYLPPWYLHFALGTSINKSLPDSGYYQASAEYKELLANQRTQSLSAFPLMYRDSLRFVAHYQRGVPKLNLCNTDENGSPAWWWPLGARSISYRWDRTNDLTRYLFLQANPGVWLWGLLGVLGSGALIVAALSSGGRVKLKQPKLLGVFMLLYAGYMSIMILLPRVMYLYHYFIPLILSFILFALFVVELRSLGIWKATTRLKGLLLSIVALCAIGGFAVFRPFAYALPLSDQEVASRAWIGLWDLHCPTCERTNGIAHSTCDPKIKPSPGVFIGELKADSGYQDWGEPKQNATVEQNPLQIAGEKFSTGIGVHAYSSLKFNLMKRFTRFTGKVGMPDYLSEKSGNSGSVTFEIFVDGDRRWASPVMRPKDPAVPFSVTVDKSDSIELVVRDGGDGITNDHAIWADLELQRQ